MNIFQNEIKTQKSNQLNPYYFPGSTHYSNIISVTTLAGATDLLGLDFCAPQSSATSSGDVSVMSVGRPGRGRQLRAAIKQKVQGRK